MRHPSLRSLRRPLALGAVASLLVIGLTVTGMPAAAVGTCTPDQMPDVLATSDMQPGMTGTAWTVVQGTTPVSFAVEILGVEHNYNLPGHDFVLVRLSGPVIDATNGIAAGMSGSPVYINGKLAGALAYGVPGDDHLAGMTPAEEMVKIFDNPTALSLRQLPPRTVTFSPALRRAAADAEGIASADTPTSASMLPTPLAISGLSSRAMDRFDRMLKRLNLTNVIPYASQTVGTSLPMSGTPLQPGDSYSAVISTGDLTTGGIGTETATCGDLSIAFGHPFNWIGPTSLGLHGANVVTVVADQLHQYSYKWADIAEPHGTIDQDRYSGIRGIDGAYPTAIPITSDVTNMDLGRSRSGETDLLNRLVVPDYAVFHLMYNIDSTFDRVGDGTTTPTWTVNGIRADGSSWSFTRRNMFYSAGDTSFASTLEMYEFLYRIVTNQYEKVTITDIHQSAEVTQAQLTEQIKKVEWATPRHPVFTTNRVIPTKAGGLIRFRVTMLPAGSTTTHIVAFSMRVPASIRGSGQLLVRGGGQSGDGLLASSGPAGASATTDMASALAAGGSSSFDALLNQLARQDRQFDLIAQVFAPGVNSRVNPGRVVRPQSHIVFGQRTFALSIGGTLGGRG